MWVTRELLMRGWRIGRSLGPRPACLGSDEPAENGAPLHGTSGQHPFSLLMTSSKGREVTDIANSQMASYHSGGP